MIKILLLSWSRTTRVTSDLVALIFLARKKSYLSRVGWFNSFFKSLPVDREGQAIPWYTYNSIKFLGQRIQKNMAVFEYGSGNSTIWWSKRLYRVVSCEHDKQWFDIFKCKFPTNVEYMQVDFVPKGDYSKAILKYDKEFDIIVIDGRDRIECAKNSLQALKLTGVIVWDNSDRKKYEEGCNYLLDKGFKRIDLEGLGPINANGWCTSVFYRMKNCLDI